MRAGGTSCNRTGSSVSSSPLPMSSTIQRTSWQPSAVHFRSHGDLQAWWSSCDQNLGEVLLWRRCWERRAGWA
jgi:hypothetical protein